MTRIVGRPEDFAAEAVAGFSNLYPDIVRSVPGGVVRSQPKAAGRTALVVGGGSGHFPAFAGYVGAGFADGAVCGDVFASPSAKRIAGVVREAERGGGVVLGFGNYAGDVLNFTAAAETLRAEGMDVRTVAVTDDIASAPAERAHERRGIAGDLTVFKIAGAAAEAGLALDEVEAVARLANERTRSFGVAFTGCVLPGASEPLFRVEPGRMGIGLGIHGEPGIEDADMSSAPVLAERLVSPLLAEAPRVASTRVAVVLNGLGNTKYEELFVLWHSVAPLLSAAGLEVVAPEVGEFVTSLDMAGCSLTISWLGDELESHWTAPSAAVGFHRRRSAATAFDDRSAIAAAPAPSAPSTTARTSAADDVVDVFARISRVLAENEEYLGRLDAQAGDGDHGQGMARGSAAALSAARAAAQSGAGPRSVLREAAEGWADRAGGTSGALWGAGLAAIADHLSEETPITASDLVAAIDAAVRTVMAVGGAVVGDKTMVDALVPFSETLVARHRAGASFAAAWDAASSAAESAAAATAQLLPVRGRARTAGARNVGHVDAGAVSFALVAGAVGELFDRADHKKRREQ